MKKEKEHILVCISPSPSNKKVIEQAKKIVDAFDSKFTALYIESYQLMEKMSDEEEKMLRDNIAFAKRAGAKIVTLYGEHISEQIIEYARLTHATKIIIGRNWNSKHHWIRAMLGKKSIAKQLDQLAPELEVFQIAEESEQRNNQKKKNNLIRKEDVLWDIVWIVLIQAIATTIAYFFWKLQLADTNLILLYILAVFLHSLKARYIVSSICFSLISVIMVNFCFIDPMLSFAFYNKNYIITFISFFLTSLIGSTMIQKIKRYAKQAVQKSYRTEILLETNRSLQEATDRIEIGQRIVEQLQKLLDRQVTLYWGEKTKEKKSGDKRYDTIQSGEQIFATIEIEQKEKTVSEFEQGILRAMLNECAIVLEREELVRQQKDTEIKLRQEQLRANILRSISHDLRTPLTSLSGNASILLQNGTQLKEEQKVQLYQTMYDDANWLIQLVENLLSITRIENGTLQLHIGLEMLADVVDEALKHIHYEPDEHQIIVEEEELLLVKIDVRLMIQVVTNLVNNAIKYTQKGSVIHIRLWKENEDAIVDVIDDGEGIREEEKEKIFQMFYTGNAASTDGRRGMGLGLALCKSIIQAHHGTIQVLDQKPHGAIFRIRLQAEEVKIK